MSTKTYHAFYSAQAAQRFGSVIWMSDPARLGGPNHEIHDQPAEIEATAVYDDREEGEEAYGWLDRIYLGRVSRFVRAGRSASSSGAVLD